MKEEQLILTINRVKSRYLECEDIALKKYIGKILAGDIDIKYNKLIENS